MNIAHVHQLRAHQGAVYCLLSDAASPNCFYSSGSDGQIIQWNLNTPEKAFLIAQIKTQLFSMAQLNAGAFFALGQMQGNLHILDCNAKKEIKNISFHHQGIFSICPIAEKSFFLTAGGDGILGVWNAQDFTLVKSKKISEKSLRCIKMDHTHQQIYVGCSDHAIYVLDAATLEIVQQIEAHQNSVFCLALSNDGAHLLSGGRDAHLKLWQTKPRLQCVHALPAHLFTINAIAFHPQGKLFATASRDRHIKIWSFPDLQLLKVIDKEKFKTHTHSINHLIWNEYLISCSDDGSIIVWDVAI